MTEASSAKKSIQPSRRRAAVCLAKSRSAWRSSFSREADSRAGFEALIAEFVWEGAVATRIKITIIARKKKTCFMCAPGERDGCRDQSNRLVIGESVGKCLLGSLASLEI